MSINMVVSGSYSGSSVRETSTGLYISGFGELNQQNLSQYYLLESGSYKSDSHRRAAVGFLLFGPIGLLGGETAQTVNRIRFVMRNGGSFDADLSDRLYNILISTFYR